MGMTLDEAIKHCEEVAESEEQKYKDWKGDYSHLKKIDSCIECAEEHRQLAKWLKELKAYKEDEHSCEYCKYEELGASESPCLHCRHNHEDLFEWRSDSE